MNAKMGLATGVALGALSLFGATGRKWNPDGSGNWADDSRWTFYTAPSDRILLKGCTATMTEDDFEFLSQRAEMIFEDDAILRVTVSKDAVFPTTPSYGTGKIVKNGSGQLSIGNSTYARQSRYNLPSGGIQVDTGDLYCLCGMGPITVNAPGRLIPRADINFCCWGLYGDGTVTNSVYNSSDKAKKQFIFIGGSADNIPVFSGTFLNSIDLTTYSDDGSSIQYLTNPEACSETCDFRGSNGTIGLAKIGEMNQPSSLGKGNQVILSGSTTSSTLVYLGAGETTDRIFNFNGGNAVLDGGAVGGLTLSYELRGTYSSKRMASLVLTGSNTTACTIGRNLRESDTQATYVTKKGTGSWAISSTTLGAHGVFAVQEGTLRYASLAEKGTDCSFGYSDRLYQCYVGAQNAAPDPEKAVPYAFLLGNGSAYDPQTISATTATLEYNGSSALVCSTRLLALDGAGRLSNVSGNAFSFSGVTSATDKEHALVLASSGTDNAVCNVTNGVGSITVVKEGSGTWHLKGKVDVSGLEARAGTLVVDNAASFEYFRFSAKENYHEEFGTGVTEFRLSEFSLWDVEDNLRGTNLVYRDCVGNAALLQPGEVTDLHAFSATASTPTAYRPRGYVVENLFTNDVAITPAIRNSEWIMWAGGVKGTLPDISKSETWSGFLFRIPAGSPVVRYDLRTTACNSSTEVKSWTLEGSLDGHTWYPLHSSISNALPVTESARWRWRSDGTSEHVAGGGYVIDTTSPFPAITTPVSVRADAGATLEAASDLPVNRLVYDASAGAGVLKGLTFADSGMIDIVNAESTRLTKMTYDLSECDNLTNLSSWTVRVNGKLRPGWRVKATASGLVLQRPGLIILFK